MTSFGWKRKRISLKVTHVQDILNESEDEHESFEEDWLHLAKHKKTYALEDCTTKCDRLTEEGAILAEEGRYWEAIKRWNEALSYTTKPAKLHEMKAQALMELEELFPAVEAAEMAVKCNPRWAHAYQTLGRAQLNYGEIDMAIRNFVKAVHIDPSLVTVWTKDLPWALTLKEEKERRNGSLVHSTDQSSKCCTT